MCCLAISKSRQISCIKWPSNSPALSVRRAIGVPRRQKTCSTKTLATVFASLFWDCKGLSPLWKGIYTGQNVFRTSRRLWMRTSNQVQRRGFWLGWRRDVQRYCKQCVICSSYHRGRLPRSGPLQPTIVGTTMERCHVDITGPHPQTSRGSKYILTCVDAVSYTHLTLPTIYSV